MRRQARLVAIAWTCLVIAPAVAQAQATLAGTVKDASGAVLPGVTVEAVSPALTEKTRAAVTDGTGQFKILNLPAGTYSVVFALAGFNTVKREGVEVAGTFTATVNVDMRVGAISETVTVTGETPIVDTQSATRQMVNDHSTLDVIPTGNRVASSWANLVPGMLATTGPNLTLQQDVGGSNAAQITEMTIHGSRGTDMRTLVNGISIGSTERAGGIASVTPSVGSVQEVTVDASAVNAEFGQGGPRINFILRDGGNTLKGGVYFSGANEHMQGSNFTQELKDRGLKTPDSVKSVYDFNPAIGGPIKKDKLWWWAAVRDNNVQDYIAGAFIDRNAYNHSTWFYSPDPDRPAFNDNTADDASIRITWQATARNKVAGFYDQQRTSAYPRPNATSTSESAGNGKFTPMWITTIDWTTPLTNRILLEANFFKRRQQWGAAVNEEPGTDLTMIGINEQSTGPDGLTPAGLNYRGRIGNTTVSQSPSITGRFAASYTTGAHSAKAGINVNSNSRDNTTYRFSGSNELGLPSQFSYRFSKGVPNQITLNSTPLYAKMQLHDLGVFAQDKWTVKRATFFGGVRFDHTSNFAPETHIGPSAFTPLRDITFPKTEVLSWSDITPKTGVVYDLFGTGKTAIKFSANKYVQGQGQDLDFGLAAAPVSRLVTSTTRTWTDKNGNFFPECDLVNPLANGECQGNASSTFGKVVPGLAFDPSVTRGWGTRPGDWEFSLGVQHEILPRVSVDVSYFRRVFYNFQAIDNVGLSPADFVPYTIPAPVDTRLPDGGGYVVSGLHDFTTDAKSAAATSNQVYFPAANYGRQLSHWNGADVSANARLGRGAIQGGVSTGRTLTDNCEIVAKLPELLINGNTVTPEAYCHVETPWLWQAKLSGRYTIPRVDVQVSANFQSLAGHDIATAYTATNAIVRAPSSLGRNLSGGRTSVNVNLLAPATMYTDRVNQLDWRFGKLLRFGRNRLALNVDIYNSLNTDVVLTNNANYDSFLVPTSILSARFVKLGLQWDF